MLKEISLEGNTPSFSLSTDSFALLHVWRVEFSIPLTMWSIESFSLEVLLEMICLFSLYFSCRGDIVCGHSEILGESLRQRGIHHIALMLRDLELLL